MSGNCKKVLRSSTKGDILSPGYPASYAPNLHCSWTVITPAGSQIILQFFDFLVEKDVECASDVVKVYDGPNNNTNMIGKYCGRFNPFVLKSSGNSLFILFKTDYSTSFRGFRATYTAININTASECTFIEKPISS